MAWTTPRTYVGGELLTATILNTDIRDNLNALKDRIQSGTVSITPVANTPTSITVTFPVAFASTPSVIVSAASGVVGSTVLGVGGDTETTTDFRATVYRTNTTLTTLRWIAFIP